MRKTNELAGETSHEMTLVVLGKVMPEQYASVQQEMVDRRIKPVVRQLNGYVYRTYLAAIERQHRDEFVKRAEQGLDCKALNDEIHDKLQRTMSDYLDTFRRKFGKTYAIVVDNEIWDDQDMTVEQFAVGLESSWRLLANALRQDNPQLQVFAVQSHGRIEFVEGSEMEALPEDED